MLTFIKKLVLLCAGICVLAGAAWTLNQIDNLPIRLDPDEADHAIVYLYPHYRGNITLDQETAAGLTREIDSLGLRQRTAIARPDTSEALFGFWLGMGSDLQILVYDNGGGISVDGTAYRADCAELIALLEAALAQRPAPAEVQP